MKHTPTPKYQSVREALEKAIRSGQLRSGDQLPAEELIAQQHGVSLMTARRAVSDLVSADLLERRARFGTFVRRNTRDLLTKSTVNLITSTYEGWGGNAFVSGGLCLAEERGLNANVIRLGPGQQDSAVKSIQSGEMSIIMIDEVRTSSALGHAIRAAKDRVISLHPRLTEFGVPSIMSDVVENFRIALDHLRANGHEHIAVATQVAFDEADDTHSLFWQAAYHHAIESHGLSYYRIPVKAPLFSSPVARAFDAVKTFLSGNPQTTAIVSSGDEIAIGTLAACRECDRPVPDKMSLINIGDSALMAYASPPVTCVDLGIEQQLRIAFDILLGVKSEALADGLMVWTKSDLIERSSVGP